MGKDSGRAGVVSWGPGSAHEELYCPPGRSEPMGEGPQADRDVAIDYARPAVEQPRRSCVIVQPGEAGTTFIDPPLTGDLLRRTALFRLVIPGLGWAAMAICAAVALRQRLFLSLSAAVLALHVFLEGRRLLRRRRFPTMIEAGRDGLTLYLTPRRRVVIPAADLDGIRASRPIPIGRLLGRNSSLIIRAWGRSITALADRDYPEMLWLAQQLRIATGRAANHPGEPAPPWPPSRHGEFHGNASRPAAEPKAAKKTFGQFLFKEYDDLRCAPGLFLLASAVIGLFVTSRLIERLIICLQFGLNAYFRNGVRPIPHRGFFNLNNGHQIADGYKALFCVLCMCALLGWAFLSLLIAIVWNRLADRLQRRRFRLRAEQEKRDRVRRQTR
jgi:hypothetical protein